MGPSSLTPASDTKIPNVKPGKKGSTLRASLVLLQLLFFARFFLVISFRPYFFLKKNTAALPPRLYEDFECSFNK